MLPKPNVRASPENEAQMNSPSKPETRSKVPESRSRLRKQLLDGGESVQSDDHREPFNNARLVLNDVLIGGTLENYGEGDVLIGGTLENYGEGARLQREPVNRARFPLLDEALIAERGWRLPTDNGGGKSLTVSQTGIASRGFPISSTASTTLQTGSKLKQLWNTFHKKGASFFKKATSVPRDKQINFSTKNAKMTLRNDTPHHH